MGGDSFKIVRMYRDDRPQQTKKRGLTEEEARAWCHREDTHFKGTLSQNYMDAWFDGFEEE